MKRSVYRALGVVSLGALMAAASLANAQPGGPGPLTSGNPAWFSQVLPPPVSDLRKLPSDDVSTELPALPAKFGPGPTSPILAGPKIKGDLATLIDFSLKSKASGEYLWGRMSGSPFYHEAIVWGVGRMKASGLKDARVEDFTTVLTTPLSGELRLIGDPAFGEGSRDIVLQSAMVGGRGPVNGTVTAPMIYVGHATAADLVGRDIQGKIAVMVTTPAPGVNGPDESARIAPMIRSGAAGVIEIMAQPGNMQTYDADRHGCGTSLCFTLGGADGAFLESVLSKAALAGKTVNAKLSAKSSERTGLKSANGVATIPGKTDRTIIINAHADSFFQGADDNGGGTAVLLALAEYFAKRPQLNHTLVFVLSAGHHSQGNGIAAFRKVEFNEKNYVAKADLIVNIEHVGASALVPDVSRRSEGFLRFGRPQVTATTDVLKHVGVTNRAPFLIDVWKKGVDCFGLALQRDVSTSVPGELGMYRDLTNTPMTQMISSAILNHTSGESLATVPPETLERAARFHAYLIETADAAAPALLKGAAYTPTAGCPRTP